MLRFNFVEREESIVEKLLKPDVVIALLLFMVWAFSLFSYVNSLKKREVYLQQENKRLTLELTRLKKIEKEEKKLEKMKTTLTRKLKVITELDAKRKVPHYFYLLSTRNFVPKGVWLDIVKQNKNNLYIGGSAFNLNLVSEFLKKVENDLGNVTFKSTVYNEEKFSLKDKDISIEKVFKYYRFQFNTEMNNGL